MFFSTGLKGIHSDDAEKVEKLIFDTLERIAQGAPAELVDAAVTPWNSTCVKRIPDVLPEGFL